MSFGQSKNIFFCSFVISKFGFKQKELDQRYLTLQNSLKMPDFKLILIPVQDVEQQFLSQDSLKDLYSFREHMSLRKPKTFALLRLKAQLSSKKSQ